MKQQWFMFRYLFCCGKMITVVLQNRKLEERIKYMDTQKRLLVENIPELPDELMILEIDKETKLCLKKYLSYSETLQNIHQLFEVYLFNLNQIDDFCTMYYNDEIIRNYDGKEVGFIEINALLINVISAGKTLVEGIEKFIKTEISEERAGKFKKEYISKKYDDVFSFRFLYYLRNFAQHGNLPVSKSLGGTFCFDLSQIMATLHIPTSPSIKQSMEQVARDIVEKHKSEPRIAFTYTLEMYNLTIVELYYSFIKEIEEESYAHYNKIQQILKETPELIIREGGLKDMVVFELEDDYLHMFSSKDNLRNMHVDYKKEAKEKVKYFNRIHKNPRKLCDECNEKLACK